jgi:hypothetical protein
MTISVADTTSEGAAKMERITRKVYTYEFKMEAVRLVPE